MVVLESRDLTSGQCNDTREAVPATVSKFCLSELNHEHVMAFVWYE